MVFFTLHAVPITSGCVQGEVGQVGSGRKALDAVGRRTRRALRTLDGSARPPAPGRRRRHRRRRGSVRSRCRRRVKRSGGGVVCGQTSAQLLSMNESNVMDSKEKQRLRLGADREDELSLEAGILCIQMVRMVLRFRLQLAHRRLSAAIQVWHPADYTSRYRRFGAAGETLITAPRASCF